MAQVHFNLQVKSTCDMCEHDHPFQYKEWTHSSELHHTKNYVLELLFYINKIQ